MEILLNLWDELDDLAGACRHVATSTVAELAQGARPLATAGLSALWSLKNLI